MEILGLSKEVFIIEGPYNWGMIDEKPAVEITEDWCVECKAPEKSRDHKKHKNRNKYAAMVAQGFCIVSECVAPSLRELGISNSARCQEHFEEKKLQAQKLKNERISKDLCIKCEKEPLLSKTLGKNCLSKKLASDHLGSARRVSEIFQLCDSQDGRCGGCGIEIEIGVNTIVGHKDAITRSPLYLRRIKEIVNPSKKDLEKLNKEVRKELAKNAKIEDICLLCTTCSKFQDVNSWKEFEDRACLMYDHNINQKDLEMDDYACHWIKICLNLKLRPLN